MAGKPIAAFALVSVVSTLPAGPLRGHFQQGTAVPAILFSQFPRSLAGACTMKQGRGLAAGRLQQQAAIVDGLTKHSPISRIGSERGETNTQPFCAHNRTDSNGALTAYVVVAAIAVA